MVVRSAEYSTEIDLLNLNLRMLFLVPISTMSSTGVDPSAVQIFTDLACRSLRPTTFAPTCASDPKVEAAVSWLMTGE